MTEKQMVEQYVEARRDYEISKEDCKLRQDVMFAKEARLIESLNDKGATSTAKYDGIGSVTLKKPKLYASVLKENEDTLFEYLHSVEHEALIKQTVHHSALSTFVTSLVEQGEEVPEFISYYTKQIVAWNKG